MPDIEVALVHWPRDRDRRDQLATAMLPRLLLVPEDEHPPTSGDLMEDWVRLPADERDVAARLRSLADRAARSLAETVVIDGRCLRRAALTVPLSPAEAGFARLLVAAQGRLVPRTTVITALWGEQTAPPARAIDDLAYRLRKRIGPLGLDVVTARGRGFALSMLRPLPAAGGA